MDLTETMESFFDLPAREQTLLREVLDAYQRALPDRATCEDVSTTLSVLINAVVLSAKLSGVMPLSQLTETMAKVVQMYDSGLAMGEPGRG